MKIADLHTKPYGICSFLLLIIQMQAVHFFLLPQCLMKTNKLCNINADTKWPKMGYIFFWFNVIFGIFTANHVFVKVYKFSVNSTD